MTVAEVARGVIVVILFAITVGIIVHDYDIRYAKINGARLAAECDELSEQQHQAATEQSSLTPDAYHYVGIGVGNDGVALVSFTGGAGLPHVTLGHSEISIDADSGEVTIPDGLSLTDASKKFWNAVAEMRGQKPPFPTE